MPVRVVIGEDLREGVGYLLKERVGDLSVFIDAVHRVAEGGKLAIEPPATEHRRVLAVLRYVREVGA